MRRLNKHFCPGVLIATLALFPAACKHRPKPPDEAGDANKPAMMLAMSDARTSMQLIHGFYQLEAGAWRWTGQTFGASLRVPPNAARNGARLMMKVTVPQTQLDKLKSLTLGARVNGVELGPETYTRAGEFLYQREIPATVLLEDMATVEFSLDKVAPPVPPDVRELGIVVTNVGFMEK
ncbi:MAG: hypothetical protein ABSF98_12725 [Bryobacteraceae bacterium]|jgi:hypothetical protein